jgi:hypothetical protein
VFKWAAKTEQDALMALLKDGGDASGLSEALEKTPVAGYIWNGGPLGYVLRYAQKIQLPDGGERIIVLTDRPLGSWSRDVWKPTKQVAVPEYPFTLVELRLNKQGRGEGKMSLAARITAESCGRRSIHHNQKSSWKPSLTNRAGTMVPGVR